MTLLGLTGLFSAKLNFLKEIKEGTENKENKWKSISSLQNEEHALLQVVL